MFVKHIVKQVWEYLSACLSTTYYIKKRDGRLYPFVKRPFMATRTLSNGRLDEISGHSVAYIYPRLNGYAHHTDAMKALTDYAGEDIDIDLRY